MTRLLDRWAVLLAAGVLVAVAAGGRPARADVDVLTDRTPWRVYLVIAPPVVGTAEEHKPVRNRKMDGPSPLPPAGWTRPAFDDTPWARYEADLFEAVGQYGYWQSPRAALVCLRTRFGIDDPSRARDLALSLVYRGGAVVYVNGQEVARGHLPDGPIEPMTLAADYPPEAYVTPEGKRLPRTERPAEDFADRYEKRIRRLRVTVPTNVLRKGGNVLAVELHRTAVRERSEWSTVGLCGLTLTSTSGEGVVSYAAAADGVHVWNASPMATVSPTADGEMPYRSTWNCGPLAVSPAGLVRGNPFDPLRPMRMVAPRGGVASGQVVVSASGGVEGLTAKVGALARGDGTALPAGAVALRFAVQAEDGRYCDALVPAPADGAAVQPVWVLVDVPRDQPPGWYAGPLTVTAGERTVRVPVQVLVSGWTLPAPAANRTFAGVLQSPDTLALHYDVPPLSDRHFALLEKSFALMGRLGNDVLYVPVVHGTHLGHRTGFIRWVKKGDGYAPDFTAMRRLMDLYEKHCGRPKVVVLHVWKPQYGSTSLFRGAQVKDREPVVVTELDPATGAMRNLEAPLFGEDGSEAFWKPALDGARRLVKARGWDERWLLLGQGYDSRPVKQTLAFFNRIAPGMRWNVYSHWVKDPGPKDGRLVVNDGLLEVGFREEVSGGALPALSPKYPEVPEREYYVAGGHRIEVLTWSSPTAWRNLPNMTGTVCRIGLDFWPVTRRRGRLKSVFNTGVCGSWLYKSNPVRMTEPGPDGAVPTVRFRMLLEGVQETEARIAIARALPGLEKSEGARLQRLLDERVTARRVAAALTQAQISLDWLGLTAREFAAAAELAGEPPGPAWDAPPEAGP